MPIITCLEVSTADKDFGFDTYSLKLYMNLVCLSVSSQQRNAQAFFSRLQAGILSLISCQEWEFDSTGTQNLTENYRQQNNNHKPGMIAADSAIKACSTSACRSCTITSHSLLLVQASWES